MRKAEANELEFFSRSPGHAGPALAWQHAGDTLLASNEQGASDWQEMLGQMW